jgi:hypothetical protein
MRGNTREELEAATVKINNYLSKNPIVGRFMGKTINYNLGVSYGIEETIQKAEEALSRHKAAREGSGIRPRRGETPGTIVRELAERHGIDVPIRAKDQGQVAEKPQEPTKAEEIAMSIPERPKQAYTEDDLRFLPPALEVEITAIDPETQRETKERVSAERAYNEQVNTIDRLYDFLECLKTAV